MMLSRVGVRCSRACTAIKQSRDVTMSPRDVTMAVTMAPRDVTMTPRDVTMAKRELSLMSKIPFIGKGKKEESNFNDIVNDRSEEWYEQDLPSEEHLESVLYSLAQEHLGATETDWRDATFPDLASKFAFLTACITEFQRDIPSSELSYLVTVQDVVRYYQTPVQRPKYIELRPQSLPLNVKICMESINKPLDQS